MSGTWTEERRKKQAERIAQIKPWEKATGPKTAKGKARSSRNALKHGARSALKDDYVTILKLNREFITMLSRIMALEKDINERNKRRLKKIIPDQQAAESAEQKKDDGNDTFKTRR